jgi:hypothetical protein
MYKDGIPCSHPGCGCHIAHPCEKCGRILMNLQLTMSYAVFNGWFTDLLLQQESCLLRDILRNQKKNLFQEWLKVKPTTYDGE